MEQVSVASPGLDMDELTREQQDALRRARRTAFVARFIVMRESKRSRAHRLIEKLEWQDATSAEDLYRWFRQIFIDNGDNMEPVDRDLRRALAHASRSINYFIAEYDTRATLNFIDALYDYERSNQLLFGAEDEQPKLGGWRLPQELERSRTKAKKDQANSGDGN